MSGPLLGLMHVWAGGRGPRTSYDDLCVYVCAGGAGGLKRLNSSLATDKQERKTPDCGRRLELHPICMTPSVLLGELASLYFPTVAPPPCLPCIPCARTSEREPPSCGISLGQTMELSI